jgi:hypothetical protein
MSRSKVISKPSVSKQSLKRKVGYEQADDEVDETRKRMVNLQMNDRDIINVN